MKISRIRHLGGPWQETVRAARYLFLSPPTRKATFPDIKGSQVVEKHCVTSCQLQVVIVIHPIVNA